MNITISINKEFGELTEKKINRIAQSFNDIVNVQNIDSQIAFFQFSDHALVLNRPNNEIAVAFSSKGLVNVSFKKLTILLDLLDLDNYGRTNISIEDIIDQEFSVAEKSLDRLGINDSEIDGVGLRILVDTFGDNPKEFKIEPRIDDFNKLYIFCNQSQTKVAELTEEFIDDSVKYLLDKSDEYKTFYLEKGGISGQ
ncbi:MULTISPECIES: hypothetical protein [Enterococcus]|uniref:hypothetical protein n=1 Tax=Enterococcus TaxID=1350 RepID=UPI000E0928A6|nr:MULTISPECIES: hypothetical protein [Enterococcus]HCB28738.1 hypothetical protein [Enterococcus sp.]MCM6864828.1 hypothetical protein [Enterococcus faecium]MCM6882354.1 hypothetical protein [Enterococcus faecium]MCM6904447.1 hypothetical protein [Enterococcus faecium]MCM6913956.1 hypothetical protein [Enterococcus faecium]